MSFRTKLDYSDNRQITQRERTSTTLSGTTIFGLPFSGLTSGVDSDTAIVTENNNSAFIYATFSGNTTSTTFTWPDVRMSVLDNNFSAITPSNSAQTQSSGIVFGQNQTTTIDGNTVVLSYSGVSIDELQVSAMTETTSGVYTGTTFVPVGLFNVYSASSLDYKGRAIWIDCPEITRTKKLIVTNDATFSNIGSNASAGALHYDSDGVLTVNTSDARMKSNINTINNALNKVKNLRGITYNWNSDLSGNTRVGFVAQEVNDVMPELTFVNQKNEDKLMGVHYQDVTALLVEAIKELSSSGSTIFSKDEVIINSQTVASEDNNIELNYNGTVDSALNGGIFVNKGIDDTTNSEFMINSDGDWVTNNYIKPFGLFVPEYTPTSSLDSKGKVGEIVRDDNYIYIKTSSGWKRSNLETF
tara:strand:+ start:5153 stop:6397 length:1245 start_codon:yes stop_codon:yes gene_type:complete